jgi:hypothetical protein
MHLLMWCMMPGKPEASSLNLVMQHTHMHAAPDKKCEASAVPDMFVVHTHT